MSSLEEREQEVRRKVLTALSLRPMECLTGTVPAGVAPTMLPTDPRVRRFRASAFATRHVAEDRISKFWFRNYLWASLLRELMVRSLADAPALRVAHLPELAMRTGLSLASVHTAINKSVATGDFAKIRAEHDNRHIILLPSPEIREYFSRDIKDNLKELAIYTGRKEFDPDLLEGIGGTSYARLMIRFVSFPKFKQTKEEAVLAKRMFFFLMWDLVLDSVENISVPLAGIAKRMKISISALRLVLHQAREGGWLEPCEGLRPSAMALHRYTMLFSAGEARTNLLLDALEAVVAEPALATALDPGPH